MRYCKGRNTPQTAGVKIVVDGNVGHLMSDRKRLICRIGKYLIAAIMAFVSMFLALWLDSRVYAATLPEIFMGTFQDEWTGGDPDEISQIFIGDPGFTDKAALLTDPDRGRC